MSIKCKKCGIDVENRHGARKYCVECSKIAMKESYKRYFSKPETKERIKQYNKREYVAEQQRIRNLRYYHNLSEERLKQIRIRSREYMRDKRRAWEELSRERQLQILNKMSKQILNELRKEKSRNKVIQSNIT